MNREKLFDTVVAHAKNSGFVYQGSEIYGGLANTWDFGPLGVELKENIKKAWWRRFIQECGNSVSYFNESFCLGSKWTCWRILRSIDGL